MTLLATLLAAGPVAAQDAEADGAVEAAPGPAESAVPANVAEANERVERAETLFEQGDYDGALAEFEHAYETIGEHPARFMILYNIGQAHERRFRYDLAMRYYQRYLSEGGANAPERVQVQASVNALEGLLATLHIQVNVASTVWAGGRQIGVAPGDVLITAGRHVVEVRAEGYAPSQREIQIAARTEQSLEFSLSESFGGLDPVIFWSFAAATVAVGLAGGGVGIAALMRRGEIDQQIEDPALRYRLGDAERNELETLALAADILYGTAVLFGATAIVLAVLTNFGGDTHAEASADAASLRFAPWAGPSGGGAAMEVSW